MDADAEADADADADADALCSCGSACFECFAFCFFNVVALFSASCSGERTAQVTFGLTFFDRVPFPYPL